MWDVINGRSLGFHTYISRGKKISQFGKCLGYFLQIQIHAKNICIFYNSCLFFSYFAGMSIGFLLNLVYCYENNPNNRKMVVFVFKTGKFDYSYDS